ACWQRALKRDDSLTELRGEVEIEVSSSGAVKSVKIEAGNNPDLIGCLKRNISRWVFPAQGPQPVISSPLLFRGN
ncbi:MAG: hypothetical protein V1754_14360, partial [Pseudomonadota bacterium]